MKIKGRLKLVYQPLHEQSAWRKAVDAGLTCTTVIEM